LRFIRQSLVVAGKDLRAELRGKETLNASLSFSLVILLLFSFAFDPSAEETRAICGGLLWLVFAFAGALVLNRSFARDLPNDCLDALITSPLPPSALFLGKVFANLVLLVTVELICLPIFGLFFNVSWTPQFGMLFLVLVLTTWGLTVVGTMFSALTVNMRLRELMLPTLVYPIMIPGLLAAIQLTTLLAVGLPLTPSELPWLKILVGFDVIYTLLGLALVDTVLVG
jgi:heme exporter protein B